MKIILQTEARNLSNREIANNYHDLINLFDKFSSIKNKLTKSKPKPVNS